MITKGSVKVLMDAAEKTDAFVTERNALVDDLTKRFRQFQNVPLMHYTDLIEAAREAFDNVVDHKRAAKAGR